MCEHVKNQLSAYIDNELDERTRQSVERHLAQCPACREELETLRCLSQLLLDNDFAMPHVQPEQLVAQVGLQLPRREPSSVWPHFARVGWWLLPVGIMGVWLFMDVVLGVTRIILLLIDSGLVSSELPSFLLREGGQTILAGDIWHVVQFLAPHVYLFFVVLLVQLALVLLYWSWLASWQIFRRHQRI